LIVVRARRQVKILKNFSLGDSFYYLFTVDSLDCFNANNGRVTITPVGGKYPYQYSLNAGVFNSNNVISNLTPTAHSIQIKDVYNCTLSLNIALQNPSPILIQIDSNISNPCFGDALEFDYLSYFKENDFPKQIDYLQVDIDAGYDTHIKPLTPFTTLLGLITLPLTQYRFKVIVFEHDVNMYWRMKSSRDAQREILDGLGYTLIWKEEHEDWWIDCNAVDHQLARKYFHEN
jgi:hypothetical protein